MNFRLKQIAVFLLYSIFRQIQQMCQIDRVKSAIKILSAKKSHLFARKWTCYDKEEYRGAPDLHCLMMKHDSVMTRDTCHVCHTDAHHITVSILYLATRRSTPRRVPRSECENLEYARGSHYSRSTNRDHGFLASSRLSS